MVSTSTSVWCPLRCEDVWLSVWCPRGHHTLNHTSSHRSGHHTEVEVDTIRFQLKFGLGYEMYSNRSSSADSLRRLSDLCQDLDRHFTRFMERPTVPNIYYVMVAYIHNFYTPENIVALNPLDRKNLNIVVICLLCYGRHYMYDNFKLHMLEEIDTSY